MNDCFKTIISVLILLTMAVVGYIGGSSDGSQQVVQTHFEKEVAKWMAGQTSKAKSASSDFIGKAPPIDYDIRSIVPAEPDPFAMSHDGPRQDNYASFPAFVFNTVLQWSSEAGTPMETVTKFNMTWNTNEKKWYIREEL
jgi:hypothetical protein